MHNSRIISFAVLILLSLSNALPAFSQANRLLDRITYIGNASYHVRTKGSYDLPLSLYVMVKEFEAKPDTKATVLADRINQLRADYRERNALANGDFNAERAVPVHAVRSIFEILKSDESNPAVPAAMADELLSWYYRRITESNRLPIQRAAQAGLFNDINLVQFIQDSIWDDVYTLAEQNPEFRKAVDLVASTEISALTSDTRSQILSKNDAYKAFIDIQEIRDILEKGGLATGEDLKRLERNLVDRLSMKLAETQTAVNESLKRSAQSQANFEQWAADEGARRKAAAQAAYKRKVEDLQIEAQRSALYIVTEIMRFSDPESAQRIGVLGNALIKAQEINLDFSRNSELGGEAASLALSAATLNYVGLAISIVSAFSNTGGSDPTIEALKQISKQIQDLRQEMHSRFDFVDVQLDVILKSLSMNFSAIHTDLASLKKISSDTRKTAFEILARLEYLDSVNVARLQSLANINFEAKAAECYAYRGDTPGFTITQEMFVSCLAVFKQWALSASRSDLFDPAADVPSNVSAEAWAQLPEWAPLGRVVAELSEIQGVKLNRAGQMLGDRTIFLSGVDAYLAMLSGWKEHAKLVNPESLDDFIGAISQDRRFRTAAVLKSESSNPIRSIHEAYLSEIAFSRELLISAALSVNQQYLTSFGGRLFTMFKPHTEQKYSWLNLTTIKSCPDSDTHHISHHYSEGPKDIRYHPGPARFPRSWLSRLQAIDLTTSTFSGFTERNLEACYTLRMNVREGTTYDDAMEITDFYRIVKPVLKVKISAGAEIFSTEYDFGRMYGPELDKLVYPFWLDHIDYPNRKPYGVLSYGERMEAGLYATALLERLEGIAAKKPALLKWRVATSEETDDANFGERFAKARKAYVEQVSALQFEDTALRRSLNRATFLKNALARLLLEASNEDAFDMSDLISVLTPNGKGVPDVKSFSDELSAAQVAAETNGVPRPIQLFPSPTPVWINVIVPDAQPNSALIILQRDFESAVAKIDTQNIAPLDEILDATMLRLELHRASLASGGKK